IEDSCATAQYRIRSKLIGEAKARSEVVSVHRRVATTGTWEEARASDRANLSKAKLRVVGVQVATERSVDSCIYSELVQLEEVERGNIVGEVENAGRVIECPKVIQEDALLSSKLDGMSTFYPVQSRGVAEQRVGEVGIHAALRKQREERVIDTNRRHAGEPPVGGKDWR